MADGEGEDAVTGARGGGGKRAAWCCCWDSMVRFQEEKRSSAGVDVGMIGEGRGIAGGAFRRSPNQDLVLPAAVQGK